MKHCSLTNDELLTVRIALARYESFYIGERDTWRTLAEEEGNWTDEDRARFLRNADDCNKLAGEAAQLLNAPASPLA
jgi:hypothetical protein